MFYIQKLFLFYTYCYISVECLIPTLNVQKLDKKLIERQRQDTLDMCKIFTEENHNFLESPKRIKRDLKPPNSNFDLVEAKRIENIVDKIYDDMAEHGERVAYRQRNLSVVKDSINVHNQTARRFKFAPAMLLPPHSSTPTTMIEELDVNSEIAWPKHWNHGIVPYFIDSNTYDAQLSDVIISAFDYFEKATCIRLQRLRERPTDKESLQNVEWLYITNPSGIRQCVHSNERKSNRGVQMVVFGYDCMSLGEVLHEVMHILGFSHEHTRPDRDQHITVLWDNIKPGYKKYFEIRTVDPLSSLPYDYSSVLHYPSRAFSKNGQVTLLVESRVKVGQREGLSDNDVAKVTTIYSSECMKRNKEYLLNTCPSVVKTKRERSKNVTQIEIENYFKDRVWPYGIISYKIKDKLEFSTEERENLDAVIHHIEKETCIEFRDISVYDVDETVKDEDDGVKDIRLHLHLGNDLGSDMNVNETETEEVTDMNDNKVDVVKEDANTSGPKENEREPDSEKQNFIADSAGADTAGGQTGKENEENIIVGVVKEDANILGPSEKEREPHSEKQNSVADFAGADTADGQTGKETEENVNVLRKNDLNINKDSIKHIKNSSKPSYTFGSLSKASRRQKKPVPRTATTPGRRHAESTVTLVRSSEPGCRCPPSGKPKGDQVLKINADCFNSVNDLLHLFVHILGLDHQHNMHDRDSFLQILWDNLTPEIKKDMQNKLPPAAAVGFPYDYQSVMHYPWLQIKNGVTNIMYPIWNDGWAMGHWQGLSATDVNKLNLIYYEQCSLRKQHIEE